jgi:hypothetical protein
LHSSCDAFIDGTLRALNGRENDQTSAGWKIACDLLPRRFEGQHIAGKKDNVVELDMTPA